MTDGSELQLPIAIIGTCTFVSWVSTYKFAKSKQTCENRSTSFARGTKKKYLLFVHYRDIVPRFTVLPKSNSLRLKSLALSQTTPHSNGLLPRHADMGCFRLLILHENAPFPGLAFVFGSEL